MKITCQQCKKKFEFDDTYGLCPNCNYYNTPSNSTPDLDDENTFNSIEKTQEEKIDTSSYSPPVKTNKTSNLLRVLVVFIAILILFDMVFNLFSIFFDSNETLPEPQVEAPYVDSYEDVTSDVEIEELPPLELNFDEQFEESIQKCELPINLLIDEATNSVTGYTTTPNLICNTAIIPDGIESIGDYAFKDCDDLEILIISQTVSEIGKYAFANLPNLKCIFLYSSQLKVIDDYAFYGVEADEIYIPPTVEYIGDYAMYNMNIVDQLSPNTTLGINAIKHEFDKNLVENDMQITNGVLVKYVGTDTHVDVPIGVTQINTNAFMSSNVKTITLPEGLDYIGKNAFYVSDLTEISFPDSLTVIDDYAFEASKNLEKVVFNENLQKIGHKAFSECAKLDDFKLPQSLNDITLDSFKHSLWEDKNKPPNNNDWIINNTLVEIISDTTEILTIQDGINWISSYSINGHMKKPEKIIFPTGTIAIQKYSINIPHQTTITLQIPSTVTFIDDDLIPFSELDHEVIYIECEENSYAHNYAERNGIYYTFY